MKNEKIEIKNELLYLFLLVLITEIFFDSVFSAKLSTSIIIGLVGFLLLEVWFAVTFDQYSNCLLYTSDAADDLHAADDLLCVDLGGRRIIKKKIQTKPTKQSDIRSTTTHTKQHYQ